MFYKKSKTTFLIISKKSYNNLTTLNKWSTRNFEFIFAFYNYLWIFILKIAKVKLTPMNNQKNYLLQNQNTLSKKASWTWWKIGLIY
jgi:hypothetical protein